MAAKTTKKRAAAARPAKTRAKRPTPAKASTAKTQPAEANTITIGLDTSRKMEWFATTKSENAQLQGLKCTEAELIKKAAKASGAQPDAIARTGMIAYAKRLLANAANPTATGGKGVAGANDEYFREAYAALQKEPSKVITPSRLAYKAGEIANKDALKRGYRSAERWLRLNHPQEAGG
jgi:hypothetical protein